MFHSPYQADECVYCYYFSQVKYSFRRLFGRLISNVLFLAAGVIFSKPKFVSLTHPLRIILWFSVILRGQDKSLQFDLQTFKIQALPVIFSSYTLPHRCPGEGAFLIAPTAMLSHTTGPLHEMLLPEMLPLPATHG